MRVPFVVVIAALVASNSAAQISVRPADGRPLTERIRVASTGSVAWVGYAFRRLMEPNNFISTGWSSDGTRSRVRTMEHMLAAAGDPDSFPTSAGHRNWQSDVRVEKRIAVLMNMSDSGPTTIEYQTTDLVFDSSRGGLVWLGDVGVKESGEGLIRLFERSEDSVVKERLVRLIGLHHSGTDAESRFLRKVLTGPDDPAVRRNAAMALGEFVSVENLVALAHCARNDPASRVARAAVWALSEQQTKRAIDTLVALLQQSTLGALRRDVIQAIANKAAERAVPILQEVIENDPDAEVRRMAVWSLSNLPDNSGVPLLITLARSGTSSTVRKAAIQALAQSKDERATQALIEIVRTP